MILAHYVAAHDLRIYLWNKVAVSGHAATCSILITKDRTLTGNREIEMGIVSDSTAWTRVINPIVHRLGRACISMD